MIGRDDSTNHVPQIWICHFGTTVPGRDPEGNIINKKKSNTSDCIVIILVGYI